MSPVLVPSWRGWVAPGMSGPVPAEAGTATVQLAGAAFCLPAPEDHETTSWAQDAGSLAVFTGYLYNRRELAAELGLPIETCRPAEVALAGYRRWSSGLLERLEGSFCVAVWDGAAASLLAGRDAIGLHPFFYSAVRGGLVFSWDVYAVLRHPAVSRELNRVLLVEHLTHHWWNPRETFFQAVHRLPPGHGLKFHGGRLELFRYWDPVPSAGPVRWITPAQMPEWSALFQNAVAGAMGCGQGRAGVLLSGGLDSVSVALAAQQVAEEKGWPPPQALSVIFPADSSEEETQRTVARTLNLSQSFVRVADYESGPGVLQSSLDLASSSPSPSTFMFGQPFQDLLRLGHAKGCQVALTGDGGDETLGVSPVYTADLMRAGDWRGIVQLLRTLFRYWPAPPGLTSRRLLWTYGLRALLRDWMWRRTPGLALRRRRQLLPRAIPPWVAPDPDLRRTVIERFEQHWDRQTGEHSFYLTAIDNWLLHPLPQMIFEEQYYRNAPSGIPVLHPYWHRPVVEFLLRTPPALLNTGGQWKSLVRRAVVNRFPELGFDRQKKFLPTANPVQLLQKDGPALWRALGPARSMAALGVVDLERYHAMLDSQTASSNMMDLYHLWHGAVAESWVRHHV